MPFSSAFGFSGGPSGVPDDILMRGGPDAASRMAAAGRNGDSLLADITPGVAALLKAMGGSGTINPRTKLPEFWAEGSGDLAGSAPGVNAGMGGGGNGGAQVDQGWLDRFGAWVKEQAAKMTGLDLITAVAPAGGFLNAGFSFMDDRNKAQIAQSKLEGTWNEANQTGTLAGLMGERVGIANGPGPVDPTTGGGGPGEGGGADAGPNSWAIGEAGLPAAAAANQPQDNSNQLAAQNAKDLMAGLFAPRTTGRPNPGTFQPSTSGGRGSIARMVARAYGGEDMGFSDLVGGGGVRRSPAGGGMRGKWDISFLGDMGRDGDSIVAHINPEEAAILKALGGRGTPNPQTGLLEFAPIDRNSGLGRLIYADTGDAEINRLHNDFFGAYNSADDAGRTGVVNDFVSRRQARLRNLNNDQLGRYKQAYAGQTFEGADATSLINEADSVLAGRGTREQFLRGATGVRTGVSAIDSLNGEYANRFTGLGDADFNTLTADIERRRREAVGGLSIDDLGRYKSAYANTAYSNLVGEADSVLNGLNGTSSWLQGVIDRDSGVSPIENLHSDFMRDWRSAGAANREGVSRTYETRRRSMLQGLNETDLNKFLTTYGDLGNLRGEFTSEFARRSANPSGGFGSIGGSGNWLSQITGASDMLKQLQGAMSGLFPTAAPAQSSSFRDASAMPTSRRRWKVNPYTGALEAGTSAMPRRSFGSTIMV